MTKSTSADMENSLLVMDVADRLHREEQSIDQASRLNESRQALKERIQTFYRSQGKSVSEKHIDQAISQRLDSRLVYTPPRGRRAFIARRLLLAADSSSTRQLIGRMVLILSVPLFFMLSATSILAGLIEYLIGS